MFHMIYGLIKKSNQTPVCTPYSTASTECQLLRHHPPQICNGNIIRKLSGTRSSKHAHKLPQDRAFWPRCLPHATPTQLVNSPKLQLKESLRFHSLSHIFSDSKIGRKARNSHHSWETSSPRWNTRRLFTPTRQLQKECTLATAGNQSGVSLYQAHRGAQHDSYSRCRQKKARHIENCKAAIGTIDETEMGIVAQLYLLICSSCDANAISEDAR